MPIPQETLARLRANDPSLTEIELCYIDLNDQDMFKLKNALIPNTSLSALDVSFNNISNLGTRALSTNTTITNLNIRFNKIGDEGAKVLAANTTITHLDIICNKIGVEGAKALAKNSVITNLDMALNNIGTEGARALAANATITDLNISDNDIGAEGARALAANATITDLNISDNDIGAEGARALASNKTITNLNVHCNYITSLITYELNQAIANNHQAMLARRDNFVRAVILFAAAHKKSFESGQQNDSLWLASPRDMQMHILESLCGSLSQSVAWIGKKPDQVMQLVLFAYYQIDEILKKLKTGEKFNVIENSNSNTKRQECGSRFFLPSRPSLQTTENNMAIQALKK